MKMPVPGGSPSICDRVLRLNPRYRMLPFARVPAALKPITARLSRDPDLFGFIYCAASERRPAKAVSKDVWRLLSSFKSPRSARSAAGVEMTRDYERFLRRQVIEGVLEVQDGSTFRSGLAAMGSEESPTLPLGEGGRIARLSRRGIELAYRSGLEDVSVLAGRVYFYNRLPLSLAWLRRFPDEGAVMRFLKIRPDGGVAGADARLRRGADPSRDRETSASTRFWRYWTVRGAPEIRPADESTCKVYVSPAPEHLDVALHEVLGILPDCGAAMAKVGRDVRGLLRPDKLVVYFRRPEDARAFGRRVSEACRGVPAQGVPFTSQISRDALVTMGVDPPRMPAAFEWQESSSWRVWIAHRIARAILSVRRERPDDPIEAVYRAVESAGIDTSRWRPTSDRWDFEI